jgi:hypothetical protein
MCRCLGRLRYSMIVCEKNTSSSQVDSISNRDPLQRNGDKQDQSKILKDSNYSVVMWYCISAGA